MYFNTRVKDGQGFDVQAWKDKCYGAMSDNFNSPILTAHLFEAVKFINASEGGLAIADGDLESATTFKAMVFDILRYGVEIKAHTRMHWIKQWI